MSLNNRSDNHPLMGALSQIAAKRFENSDILVEIKRYLIQLSLLIRCIYKYLY